jgi:hypothetical protein
MACSSPSNHRRPAFPACSEISPSRMLRVSRSACPVVSTRKAIFCADFLEEFRGGASASGLYLLVTLPDGGNGFFKFLLVPLRASASTSSSAVVASFPCLWAQASSCAFRSGVKGNVSMPRSYGVLKLPSNGDRACIARMQPWSCNPGDATCPTGEVRGSKLLKPCTQALKYRLMLRSFAAIR